MSVQVSYPSWRDARTLRSILGATSSWSSLRRSSLRRSAKPASVQLSLVRRRPPQMLIARGRRPDMRTICWADSRSAATRSSPESRASSSTPWASVKTESWRS